MATSPPTSDGEPLSVRVGVGWNPLDRGGVGGPLFWETVELLEALGYDSLWLSDTATQAGAAPLPMLAAAAARTERLKLGTSVLVVPARNPMLLAKELATIDLISNGRIFPAFGIGRALPAELAALGVAREERAARFEECVTIVRELWQGEPVTYHGRFSTLDDVTLTPRPKRRRLDLWLGGSSTAGVRRVARIADGWLGSSLAPETFAELADAIRVEAAAVGRTVPEDHFGIVLHVAATEAEAESLRASRRQGGRDLPADAIAVGIEGTRSLLWRFRAAGATKFVLYPLSPDPRQFLRELKNEVVDAFEAEPVYRRYDADPEPS
jgi:probable F420-dependent oxidoreductase